MVYNWPSARGWVGRGSSETQEVVRETQLYSFPSLANIHRLFYSSRKPCQRVSAQALFPTANPVGLPSKKAQNLSISHPLQAPFWLRPPSPSTWLTWIKAPAFSQLPLSPVCTPHRSALGSHHSPPQPELQPTGLLMVPQTYQALPASGPLHLLCSLPRILSHQIST